MGETPGETKCKLIGVSSLRVVQGHTGLPQQDHVTAHGQYCQPGMFSQASEFSGLLGVSHIGTHPLCV